MRHFTRSPPCYNESDLRGIMKTVFDPKQHLASCFELTARNPEPFYDPKGLGRCRRFDECGVLYQHEDEVIQLRNQGAPLYLAQAIVLEAYAHTRPSLEKRVKEAKGL